MLPKQIAGDECLPVLGHDKATYPPLDRGGNYVPRQACNCFTNSPPVYEVWSSIESSHEMIVPSKARPGRTSFLWPSYSSSWVTFSHTARSSTRRLDPRPKGTSDFESFIIKMCRHSLVGGVYLAMGHPLRRPVEVIVVVLVE